MDYCQTLWQAWHVLAHSWVRLGMLVTQLGIVPVRVLLSSLLRAAGGGTALGVRSGDARKVLQGSFGGRDLRWRWHARLSLLEIGRLACKAQLA